MPTDNSIDYDVYIMLTVAYPHIAIPIDTLVTDYKIKITYQQLLDSQNNAVLFLQMKNFIDENIPDKKTQIEVRLNPIS